MESDVRVVRWALAGVLVLLGARAQAQPRGAPEQECVAPELERAALACPPAPPRSAAAAAPTPPAPRPASPAPGAAPPRPEGTRELLAPSATRARRSLELLRHELGLLSELTRNLRREAPNRPDVLQRFADLLQDLAASEDAEAQRLEEPLFRARTAQNANLAGSLEREQAQHRAERAARLRQAVQLYERLLQDYPTHPRAERALFEVALAQHALGDSARALEAWRGLLERFPASVYQPHALVAFGDHHFDAGRLAEARAFYERAASLELPSNSLRGYALYRLAWTHYNLQSYERALQAFYAVVDLARQEPSNASNAGLLRTARNELVTAYGAAYGTRERPLDPAAAQAAFRRYAADEAGAAQLLERLAELYQDNGQWPNAVALYHQLLAQRGSEARACLWQAQVARAVVASRPREEQWRELQRTLDLFERYRGAASRFDAQARAQCRDSVARVLFDVASHWHLEAVGQGEDGSPQTRGTRDHGTMRRAAELYRALLDRVEDLDQVTFPEYQRSDWPTRYRLAYYLAELLRAQANVAECGAAYDRVLALDPQGPYTEDAAYKAVLCRNDFFAQRDLAARRPASADHARRALDPHEEALLRALERYLCVLRASASQPGAAALPPEQRRDALTLEYRRAWMLYNANHFEEAAPLLRAVALGDATVPDPENLREIAADLYLDALNLLGNAEPPRPACFSRMERELSALRAPRCGDAERGAHADFCQRTELMGCQLRLRRAQEQRGERHFREAARLTLSLLRERLECPRARDFHLDQVLYNLASDLDASEQLGRAMRVRERLVRLYLRPVGDAPPRGSSWALRALYRLAANYHALQVFSRAAEHYEEYAALVLASRGAPGSGPEEVAQAAEALRQATLFRVALGDEARALGDAERFSRAFGADPSRRRLAAAVLFSIGQLYQDRAARLGQPSVAEPARDAGQRAAWQQVVRHYTDYVNRFARNGTLDQQVLGHVALGRGYWNLGDAPRAQLYLRAASELWGDAGASALSPGETRLREELHEQPTQELEVALARTRDAVAEARFLLAETETRVFLERRLPAYHGGPERRAFDAWTARALAPFVQAQLAYLRDEAPRLYRGVFALHVPNWELAAYARLAELHRRFAELLRASPMPPDFRGPGEVRELLRVQWGVLLDERTQPFLDAAREGLERCMRTATAVRWFNDWTRRCERGLNELDRRAFPLADELRAEPTLVTSRPTNGQPFLALPGSSDEEDAEPAAER